MLKRWDFCHIFYFLLEQLLEFVLITICSLYIHYIEKVGLLSYFLFLARTTIRACLKVCDKFYCLFELVRLKNRSSIVAPLWNFAHSPAVLTNCQKVIDFSQWKGPPWMKHEAVRKYVDAGMNAMSGLQAWQEMFDVILSVFNQNEYSEGIFRQNLRHTKNYSFFCYPERYVLALWE